MAELCLAGVEKRLRGGVTAVRGVSFTVADGGLVVLAGPSGCGKTTTLRLVAGLEKPDRGRVLLGGVDVTGLPPRRRDVAMVFQDDALAPHLNVEENIALPLRLRGVGRGEAARAARGVAESLGIGGFAGRRPSDLSGGERRRVAVARALVRRPAVCLMDEPLTGLDAPLRRELRLRIAEAQRDRRVTTLYVTHDQEEALALADELVLIEHGAVRQTGPPDELYRRPQNLFVAGFLGSPAMNFLRGEVAAGYFRADGVRWPASIPDGPAILGVRPEHLRLSSERNDSTLGAGRLVSVEHGGRDTVARYALEDSPGAAGVAVLLPPCDPPMTAHVAAERGDVMFFAADEGGERLG